jgi:hypothetical protein
MAVEGEGGAHTQREIDRRLGGEFAALNGGPDAVDDHAAPVSKHLPNLADAHRSGGEEGNDRVTP